MRAGRTCLGFRPVPYHSAACRRGDVVERQTWAEPRTFLFDWNAIRSR